MNLNFQIPRRRTLWTEPKLFRLFTSSRPCRSNSHEAHMNALYEQTRSVKEVTFETLGLHPPILSGLYHAFPSVKRPTATQQSFIPAVLSGKDVFLKDKPGSGKSFGLILALLNKPRVRLVDSMAVTPSRGEHSITSLLLVPHRDLAYQMLQWIRLLADAAPTRPPISSIVQVLVRDQKAPPRLDALREEPPHILIGTPQALQDAWKQDPHSLQLDTLSTVVVDEADYLIETVFLHSPGKLDRATLKKLKLIRKHPGATRELLDIIYAKRKEALMDSGQDKDERLPGPQLIFSSATLRAHFTQHVLEESGWLVGDNYVEVFGGTGSSADDVPNASQDINEISHSVLVVSRNSITNIPGALLPPLPLKVQEEPEKPESPHVTIAPSEELEPALVKQYSESPSPFNPDVLEAVATVFALDVPAIALLVLPSSAPVQRAVFELREMGINAHGLDLLSAKKGGAYLQGGKGAGVAVNPVLLVATLATTRGVDLPHLTHVFVTEPSTLTAVDYLHVAGRAGRIRGQTGTIVTFVEQDETEGKWQGDGRRSELGTIGKILQTIKVTPVKFRHFE